LIGKISDSIKRKAAEEAKAEAAKAAAENTGDGTSSMKNTSKLDTMKQENETMKKTLDERETLLKRQDEIEERERVSGQASAGKEQLIKKKPQKNTTIE